MPKFTLGQRVRYKGVMRRYKGAESSRWGYAPLTGEGIIVGKRNVSEGYTDYNEEEGYTYHPTKHYAFWLVAPNLSGYRYVAEGDLEATE